MRARKAVLLFVATACGSGGSASDSGPIDAAPAPPVDAGGPAVWADPFVLLQPMPFSPAPESLEVRALADGRLLACTGRRGLLVVDAADAAAMKLLHVVVPNGGGVAGNSRCSHLAWNANVVAVTSRGDELEASYLELFDLAAQPPASLAVYAPAGRSLEGVAAGGGFLYVAQHAGGLRVLERVGATLVERGVAGGLVNAWGVAAVGTTVYVADGSGGLAIVDASDPDAPQVVGRAATGGTALSVEVVGDRAYVAAGSVGLVIVDVATPGASVVLATADTPGSAQQVAVAGGRAYVADWGDVRVFDVADPAAPRLVATERVAVASGLPRVLGVGARDDVAFVGEWTGLYSYRFVPGRDAPDLVPRAGSVTFGTVAPGASASQALVVANEGTAPLAVGSIATTGPFTVAPTTLALAPGDKAAVEITYGATSSAEQQGTLVFVSDDPDESPRTLGLVGNKPGLDVGDLAPDVTVALVDGGTWRSSDHAGQVRLLAYFATF